METLIGITIALIVGGALLRAWTLPKRAPEPEQDPNSPYSPAGTQILAALRERQPVDDTHAAFVQEWK